MSAVRRYSLAALVTAAAVALRVAINPLTGPHAEFAIVFVSLMAVGLFAGLGPAVLSLLVGLLGTWFFVLAPTAPFLPVGLLYSATALACAVMGDAVRRARGRAESHAEALRASESRLASQLSMAQSIADNTDVLLARCSRDLRYVFVNRACADFIGRPRDTIEGSTIESVIGREALNQIRPHIERALSGETVEYEASVPYQGLGPRVMHVHYIPDFDGAGAVQGWFASMQDVTQRREIESRLAEADRLKDEFLATLAHELRNPLAPIRTSLDIMERAGGDVEVLEEARKTMDRQVSHVERLVDDLLDVSRISRGYIPLKKERVPLAPIVHRALESVRARLMAAKHEVTVTLPPQSIYLHADPVRLTQVLTNLLDNASKYSAPGRRIRIGVDEAEGEALISVEDEGIGIPADQLSRIFEPFTQVDRTLERSWSGLGIGLMLVKRLVELHGGNVTVESDGRRGSKFVIRLPVMDEASSPSVPAAAPEAGAQAEHRRILVVDDNKDAATSLATLLRMIGHEVEIAFDGVDAVQTAERFRPEIVLLDIGLPKMNGYDACRAIRQRPWGEDVLIVALTGWGQEEDRRMAREAGFDDHLVKPVGFASLEKYWPRMPGGPAARKLSLTRN